MKQRITIRRRKLRSTIYGILFFFCTVILSVYGYTQLTKKAVNDIVVDTDNDVQGLVSYVENFFFVQEEIAQLLSEDPHVRDFLVTPLATSTESDANTIIDAVQNIFGMSVVYVLDSSGTTVLSSDRNDENSFLGKDYSFRPYYTDAINKGIGRYFALGVTSGTRGYYVGVPVYSEQKSILGVVVIKKEIDSLVSIFESYKESVLVSPQGVIFLSSNKKYVLKSLFPLSEDVQSTILASKQFGDKPFEAIAEKDASDPSTVHVNGVEKMIVTKLTTTDGWSVSIIKDTEALTQNKRLVFGVILAINFVILSIFFTLKYVLYSHVAVRDANERFEQVITVSKDWIWEMDRDGKYTYSNDSVEDILGYSAKEVIGKYFYEFICPDEQNKYKQLLKTMQKERQVIFKDVNTNVHKDGHLVTLETNAVPLIRSGGTLVGYRGVDKDISSIISINQTLKKQTLLLKEKIDQLEKTQGFLTGRELKMVELKERITELEKERNA